MLPLVVVGLAYVIVVLCRYAFLDDYQLLADRLDGARSNFEIYLGSGRPLSGVLQWAAFGLFDTVDAMRWVRGLTLVSLLLLVAVVHRSLRSWGASAAMAAVVSGGIALLPTYQVVVSWATLFLAPAAAALAWGAAALVETTRGRSAAEVVPRTATAALMVASTALVYQPATMTYLVAVSAVVLARRGEGAEDRGVLGRHGVVLGFGATCALVALEVGQKATSREGARTELVGDVAGKAHWFLTEVLPHAANPLSLSPNGPVGPLALVLSSTLLVMTLIGLFLHLHGSPLRRAALLTGLLTVAVGTYAPSLVIAENWASNRSMLALQPAVFLLMAYGMAGLLQTLPLHRWRHFGPHLALAVLVLFGARATSNVTLYFVVPQTTELRLAENAISAALTEPGPVRVVQSTYVDSIAPKVIYDEFGLPSTAGFYVPAALCALVVADRQAGADCEVVDAVDREGPSRGVSFAEVLAPLQSP